MRRPWRIRTAAMASAALLLTIGCEGDTPLATDTQAPQAETPSPEVEQVSGMLSARYRANFRLVRQLVQLMRSTAKYHNFSRAQEDYPVLIVNDELTSPDGCVSDRTAGGMGYHYAGKFGVDDHVNYLEPDLLVYAPRRGHAVDRDGNPRTRLAGFDYFIPYSDAWPADGPAPTSEDMGLAVHPAIPFAPSRFGGWMFHIWLWEYNPAGIFANWNPAVPLCADSPY